MYVCMRIDLLKAPSSMDRFVCELLSFHLRTLRSLRVADQVVMVAHYLSLLPQTVCERDSSGLLFLGAVKASHASRSILTCIYVCCHLGL